MSFFKGIADSQASRDTTWMRAGRYLHHIDSFKEFKGKLDGSQKLALESTTVVVIDDTNSSRDPKGAHRAGEKVVWVPGKQPGAMASFKSALMKITGVPEESVTEEFIRELTGQAQPLHGMFVEWECDVVSGKQGNTYTVHKVVRVWSAEEVKAAVPEQLLQSLKLDLSKA